MAQPKKKPLFIRTKKTVEPKPRGMVEKVKRLDETLIIVSNLKQKVALVKDELDDAQKDALSQMEALGLDKHAVDISQTDSISATVVQGYRSIIDEAMLQKKIGAAMWRKVTTMVLDRHKLDAYIKSGEIDPMAVAASTNETPNSPYIKITRK